MERKSAIPTVTGSIRSHLRQIGRGSNTFCVGVFALSLVNLAASSPQASGVLQTSFQPPAALSSAAPPAPAPKVAPPAAPEVVKTAAAEAPKPAAATVPVAPQAPAQAPAPVPAVARTEKPRIEAPASTPAGGG